jgi:hypothetical protein
MAGQIAHNDEVAGRQRGCEELFDIGAEDSPVHGAVDHQRRSDTVVTQAGNEDRGLPVPMWNASDDTFAARLPIDGGNRLSVISEKRLPGLRRRLRKSRHVLRNRQLGHLKAQHQQIAMDPGRAPQRVFPAHPLDQIT